MQQKINGYTREEAEELVRYIAEGKRAGRTLTELFASYGKAHGRAGGSVRNYYYKLLRSEEHAAKEVLAGKELRAGAVRPFTEEETERMLRDILAQRKGGASVRRAILNVCGGDAKQMLRYQNKYRNLLRKQPELVRAAAERAGLAPEIVVRKNRSVLEKRLENEINALYDRLALTLREENERLRETVKRLTEENELLRRASRVKGALASAGKGGARSANA